VATTIVPSLLAVVGLELWRADLRVPFSYANDGLLVLAFVKDLLADGWWLSNPALGAPYGQQLYDYPFGSGNLLHVLGLLVLGLPLGDPALTTNVYYLLGFPLTALSGYLVLRKLEVSPLVASSCAIVFSVLPYHFGRGVDHLFLSAYFTVPLACYFAILAFAGRPLVALPLRPRHRPGAIISLVGFVVACAAIGGSSTYYAGFAALLILAGGLVSAAVHRHWGSLPQAALAGGLVLATVVLSLSPVLVHDVRAGGNATVAARGPDEAERLSLRISELVFPVRGHRLAPLADLRERYEETTPLPTESNQALGLTGTVGLLTLLVVAVGALAGRGWRTGSARILPSVAAATLVALLVSTTGGFSTLLGYAGVTQLRAWNRMSIFVAFFALVAVAVLLDLARARWTGSSRARGLLVAGIVALPGLAFLDQTNSSLVPPHAAFRSAWSSDRQFTGSLELPSGSLIYQLPHVSFPEATPPGGAGAYDGLVGYLHDARYRWSFGAMRGRHADWASALAQKPLAAVLPAVAAAGFSAVQVDTLGYDDAGARVLGILGETSAPSYSRNGRLALVDLRDYSAELGRTLNGAQLFALRTLALRPVRSSWSSSFWPSEVADGHQWRWTRRPESSIALENPSRLVRTVVVELTLASGVAAPAQATVTWPNGFASLIAIDSGGATVRRSMQIGPGTNRIRLSTNAGEATRSSADPRDHLFLRVADVSIRDVTFAGAFDGDSPARSLFDVVPVSEG
jgi:phosphoglycerol transferase